MWNCALYSTLCYGHKSSTSTGRRLFHQKSYNSMALGRRQKNCMIFGQFLDTVRCPVKLRCYLKFHGARTAFCRVIEGKMASVGHRTAPSTQPAFAHIRQAPDDFCLKFKLYDFHCPGTVRCLKSTRNFRKSLNKSADAQMDRCFMSRTVTGEKRHIFAEVHIVST